jgi:hypothetical protein
MKPLILTVSCLVGLFTLLPILAWVAAFHPYIIATLFILGCLALSLAENWRQFAASIDEGLDFGSASATAEKQPLINDPMVNGCHSKTTN